MKLITQNGLPVEFTQGDNIVIALQALDEEGNPVSLTNAVFVTQIAGVNGTYAIPFPNSQHVADPDQVNNTGNFTLTLSQSNTQACGVGTAKQILTMVTIGTSATFYRGTDILEVYSPVPTS